MEWAWNAMWAYLGWNVLAPAVALALIGLLLVPGAIRRALRRARCEHARFHETMACDAICKDCGKNLGFIGSVRERQKASASASK